VDYRDDCSSCHKANPYHQAAFGPEFYHNADLYAWQWYYEVPWWLDASFDEAGESTSARESEARDFSRRHVAPPEASYGPPALGAQSGMAPPVSKASAESGQTETVAPAPDPRRDFSRREVDQASERQRQPNSTAQPTQQSKKKEE